MTPQDSKSSKPESSTPQPAAGAASAQGPRPGDQPPTEDKRFPLRSILSSSVLVLLLIPAIAIWYPQTMRYHRRTLRKGDPAAQIQALRWLQEQGEKAKAAVPEMILALNSETTAVYGQAQTMLRQFVVGDAAAIDRLLAFIEKDANEAGKTRAILFLPDLKPDVAAAKPVLLNAAQAAAPVEVRKAALLSLHRIAPADPDVERLALEGMRESNDVVRGAAVTVVSDLVRKKKELLAQIIAALDDGNARVRLAALNMVRLTGDADPRVASAVVKALADKDTAVRNTAVSLAADMTVDTPAVAATFSAALPALEAATRAAVEKRVNELLEQRAQRAR